MRTLVGNNIVDHSDVVGASPVGAAQLICDFLSLGFGANYTRGLMVIKVDYDWYMYTYER